MKYKSETLNFYLSYKIVTPIRFQSINYIGLAMMHGMLDFIFGSCFMDLFTNSWFVNSSSVEHLQAAAACYQIFLVEIDL
jgi:hypothetical protein